MSQDSQGVRAWAAPAWRRSRDVRLIWPVLILPGLRMRRRYLASAVVLRYGAAAPPQPRAMGVKPCLAQGMAGWGWCWSTAPRTWCCGGGLRGWNQMRGSRPQQEKPNRSLFCMGLIWFACGRQDFRACICMKAERYSYDAALVSSLARC